MPLMSQLCEFIIIYIYTLYTAAYNKHKLITTLIILNRMRIYDADVFKVAASHSFIDFDLGLDGLQRKLSHFSNSE